MHKRIKVDKAARNTEESIIEAVGVQKTIRVENPRSTGIPTNYTPPIRGQRKC
jgi:hypothetical protein